MFSPPDQEIEEIVPSENTVIGLLLQVAKELKAPISFAVMVVLFVMQGWLAWDHVSKMDLRDMRKDIAALTKAYESSNAQFAIEIDKVRGQLEFNRLDSRRHQVRTEVFNIKQHIKETGKSDRLQEERLDELQGEEEDLNRQLNNMHH